MSMNYSEFRRILGADPQSQDSEFLAARESGPEFKQAVAEARAFEQKLKTALQLDVPADLNADITSICAHPLHQRASWWRPVAVAASVLITVAAIGMAWKMNRTWDSVEDYVMDHYRADGAKVLALANAGDAFKLREILADIGIEMSAKMAQSVGFITLCPTPDGDGLHLVLNTDQGPLTVIYMPETRLGDVEDIHFNGMHAHLLSMQSGSAAVIGSEDLQLERIYTELYEALTPISASA